MIELILVAIIALSPMELLTKVDSVSTFPQSSGIMEQTITTTTGHKRTFKLKYFSADNGDKQLMNFIYPEAVKGVKFLLVGNNVWVYFPETGRIRRLSSRAKKQKMMGSDFTYEDMELSNLKDKFTPSDLKEDKNYYYLKLTPKKDSHISYSKLTLIIDKKTFIPIKIDFYHNNEKSPLKTLIQENIKVIDGISTPMKTIMIDNKTESKSSFITDSISYKIKIDPSVFRPDNLKED
ncbi:outer membrane lipoprotein-sorting protein [candidate division WOR-3 bacterium]|uniref:Uncharacterized protein TP-0789 domain-containing protein n=1 Tax=candidate division TA06 bacterium TaxID=2250710 RepID=A0A660SA40_UNCT6|nr:outer membrane lipoprotein-sorting protein [candidate division WOR-3 bacterium]RKX67658.1 MAG: hypothetical protein DRP44_01915 [candidate division TA06 bacterium]